MIVCSCNIIRKDEIEGVIIGLLKQNAWRLITPGLVYNAMKKRGKCCGCFPALINVIIATTHNFHLGMNTPEAKILPFIQKIRDEHERCETVRKLSRLKQRAAS